MNLYGSDEFIDRLKIGTSTCDLSSVKIYAVFTLNICTKK